MTVRGQGLRAALTLTTVTLLLATGCTKQYQTADTGAVAPQTPTALPSTTPEPTETQKADAARNDLRDSETQKSFRSGELTVNVTYSTTLPTKQWTPSASKPLTVSLSSINNEKDLQKIYLAKVSVAVVAMDRSGPLGNPTSLSDTANISPGYIVNFPYTYEQNFTIPAVDEGAKSLAITFNYELLTLVQKDTKDYTKQTAASTIKVPLS